MPTEVSYGVSQSRARAGGCLRRHAAVFMFSALRWSRGWGAVRFMFAKLMECLPPEECLERRPKARGEGGMKVLRVEGEGCVTVVAAHPATNTTNTTCVQHYGHRNHSSHCLSIFRMDGELDAHRSKSRADSCQGVPQILALDGPNRTYIGLMVELNLFQRRKCAGGECPEKTVQCRNEPAVRLVYLVGKPGSVSVDPKVAE